MAGRDHDSLPELTSESSLEASGKAGRLSTSLESEGAEFLVLGHLLIEGIVTHKTYTNNPGYDLVAIDPDLGTSARIQVKSRWRTGAEGFIIRNFNTDFVVVALLNRGSKDGRSTKGVPTFHVLPVADVKRAADASESHKNSWGKLSLRAVEGFQDRRDAWGLIRDFLRRAVAN